MQGLCKITTTTKSTTSQSSFLFFFFVDGADAKNRGEAFSVGDINTERATSVLDIYVVFFSSLMLHLVDYSI